MAKRITHPLFGKLKWETLSGWMGEIRLPYFSAFDTRALETIDRRSRKRHRLPQRIRLPRELKQIRRRKRGWFNLSVSNDDSVGFDDSRERPAAEQERAFQFLIENETRVGKVVVDGVIEAYPTFCQRFRDHEELLCRVGGALLDLAMGPRLKDLDEIAPKRITRTKLQDLICLSGVGIQRAAVDGFARVGFSFDCTWDEEHGLGVLTHKDKVLEVGQMDVAWRPPRVWEFHHDD